MNHVTYSDNCATLQRKTLATFACDSSIMGWYTKQTKQMKKISLSIMAFVLVISCAFAMTPPKAVKDSFDKKFPTASKITWGKEAAKEWEAEFTFEGSKISANFYEDGTWLETEKEIKATNLPVAVAAAIKKNYQGWAVAEADKTETSKHGTIYEADLKKGTLKKSVAYKEDGTPVKE